MLLFRRAVPLLLAAALAFTARAGVVSPAHVPVYAPPAGAWSAPLGAGLADASIAPLLPPGLDVPSLGTPEGLRTAAPLVQSLTQSLSVTPEAFAALPAGERKALVELAVEDARDQIRLKAYALAEEARAAAAKPMDREGRAELYGAVARLMEMRQHYGAWLDDDSRAAIEDGYKTSIRQAWEVKNFLAGEGRPETPRPAKPAEAVKPRYVMDPGAYALKLRQDMKNNKSGWGQDDLHALYTGYGFSLRQGGKHRFYFHPSFPQLTESVSRQNDLPPGYAQSALKLLDELERLVAAQHAAAPAPAAGPPATVTLADFAILLSQPKEKPAKPRPVEAEEKRPVRNPRPVPDRVEKKAAPEPPPEAPSATALQPATERVVELKPEPPPAKAAEERATGVRALFERAKSLWRKD